MQVKCDYCGSWMEDNEELCPNCGAANSNLKRIVDQTPKTIDELKAWYEARHLPPYETTRFFPDIDYREPKAFGIYRDGLEYVVYKNKADGSRVERYRGKDEAYAVNELYLRLKEEILNQKNANAARKGRSPNRQKGNAGKYAGCMGGCLIQLIKWAVIFVVIIAVTVGVVLIREAIHDTKPQPGAYYAAESGVYYYQGADSTGSSIEEDFRLSYEWWQFNEATQDWELYSCFDDDDDFPEGVSYKNYAETLLDLATELGLEYENFDELSATTPYNIQNSHTYTDAHHYAPQESAYYISNGQTYYYLNDCYGYSYGTGDHSGWYIYNDGFWDYYCDAEDHDALGDNLWYNDSRYYAGSSYDDYVSGSVYNFSDSEAASWTSASEQFEDTEWYDAYKDASAAYQEHLETATARSDSDNDSDWDWDSSDSWNSDISDWGSDW